MPELTGLLTSESMVTISVFGAIASAAWWLMDFVGERRSRTIDRLDQLRNPLAQRAGGKQAPQTAAESMSKMIEKATPTLAKPLQPTNEKDAKKLSTKLSYAGFRSEAAPSVFLGCKFAGLVAGFFLSGGTMLALRGLSQSTLMWSASIGGLMFYIPDVVVALIAKSRKEKIFLGLPDVLDLLVVCVESGLGLDQAMRKVSEEMKSAQPVLSEELALCNFQLQMGRARSEVLHDFGDRTGVDDVRALAAILIQADKFGSSVAQALRVQSESMRVRRRQLAEEKAAKTAVKLIFPLVIFIFPGIFVVLVGPAAITMVRQMFPMMGG